MDPAGLEAVITPRTKAILPVHLYGQPADMDPILAIARRHGLVVIEDAAQAHGAEYKGRRVGSLGDLACFSFYPGKNLGACGEGGMVVTDNPAYTRTVRMLRDWGAERKYHHELLGYNFRMEGIQGAVLRVKLRHLEAWTEARRSAAAHYNQLFAGSGVLTPEAMAWARHVYHIYAVRSPDRAGWQEALQATRHPDRHPLSLPDPPVCRPMPTSATGRVTFPHSERAAREVLSLPMFPELTAAQREEVAAAVLALASG